MILGDFRTIFAENPHKIYNIVSLQMEEFKKLYAPIILELPNVNYINEDTLRQDDDDQLKIQMIEKLPKMFLNKLKEFANASVSGKVRK